MSKQAKRRACGLVMALVASGAFGSTAWAQSVTYTYDGLGRLTLATYADGKQIVYAYDPAGNRTERVVTGEDLTPSAFDLGAPVANGQPGQYYQSAAPVVGGFNSPLTISVTGGTYRIDGGAWMTASGLVRTGQSVQVRVLAPSPGVTQTAALNIAGVTDTFQVTSVVDTVPEPFDLGGPVSNAVAGTWYTSAIVTITGIGGPSPVSMTGGQYRIGGGAWLTAPGSVSNGQTLQVQVQALPAGGASQVGTLNVGGISDTFQVTTLADTTPAAFDLGGPITGATGGTYSLSNTVTISGINAPAAVSITNGQYRIAGGAWQSAAGSIANGQTVQVRVLAQDVGGTSRTATLNVGGVTDTFSVTTVLDQTPNAFNFTAVTGAALNTTVVHPGGARTISGINAPTPISIVGGAYQINNTGAWLTTAGTVNNGDVVNVRRVTGGAYSTAYVATLTVGSFSTSFTVTTRPPPDITPDPVDWTNMFASYYGAASGPTGPAWVDGPVRTITGLDAGQSITLSFSQDNVVAGGAGLVVQVFKNGAPAAYSMSVPDSANSNPVTVGTVSVANGDTIRFRATVFDATIQPGAGAGSSVSARQTVRNQTAGIVLDTFVVTGEYYEETNCGGVAC